MKITIASSNRSHLLDVAREMYTLNNDITFITFTPKWRLKQYDIPQNITISLFWFCLPGIILNKLFPSDLTREILRILLDYSTSFHLKQCDIFICQSPHFQHSMKIARKKYKAKIILDRGSNHVRFYNQQLINANARSMRNWYMKLDESFIVICNTTPQKNKIPHITEIDFGLFKCVTIASPNINQKHGITGMMEVIDLQ